MRSALLILLLSAAWACDDGRTVPSAPPGSRSDAASAQDVVPSADGGVEDGAAPGDDATASGDDATTAHDDATTPGEDATVAPDGGPGPGPDAGVEPVATRPEEWVWTDFPESACDEGTPTGIGVNASSTSNDVLIFMNGGGACWDYATCVQFNTSAHGPFGAGQFSAISGQLGAGVLSRSNASNPFRDWTYVFVPYCTGDLHAGSRVSMYSSGGSTVTVHHVGHDNMVAFLTRLRATFPTPGKVVVSGASAGGFGTLFNYDEARQTWPNAEMYLVDDSGPLLGPAAISPALRSAWSSAWGLDPLVDALCGAACRSDFRLGYGALATRYPNDRLALLSSLQDNTIRNYLGLQPAAFQTALLDAAQNAIEPTANFEYFLVSGESHTMLGSPAQFTSGGVNLFTWLTRMVTDDAAWASTRP